MEGNLSKLDGWMRGANPGEEDALEGEWRHEYYVITTSVSKSHLHPQFPYCSPQNRLSQSYLSLLLIPEDDMLTETVLPHLLPLTLTLSSKSVFPASMFWKNSSWTMSRSRDFALYYWPRRSRCCGLGRWCRWYGHQ
jgi:hypothetical protein